MCFVVICVWPRKRLFSRLGEGGGGRGRVLHQIFGSLVQQAKKKIGPIGSKFLWKWGVKRSKINENRGQLDWKSRRKLIQLNNTFWWKIIRNLGPRISGTKCDRDKPIFSAERGISVRFKIPQIAGHHRGTSLPYPSMGVPTSVVKAMLGFALSREITIPM